MERFSALQRAENSSMVRHNNEQFLVRSFSALQRAENSSIQKQPRRSDARACVSVLFSEPKIPQFERRARIGGAAERVSVLFSEPKIPQSSCTSTAGNAHRFQCSSASRKFLNYKVAPVQCYLYDVSVLFSEPKIPQSCGKCCRVTRRRQSFSALQRAENSSIIHRAAARSRSQSFSALQRAENSSIANSRSAHVRMMSFSALQRAENSSIGGITATSCFGWIMFQCSSASRKFLNQHHTAQLGADPEVSVLFSEPKIPQSEGVPQRSVLVG